MHFLDLPAEIRTLIFSYVLGKHNTITSICRCRKRRVKIPRYLRFPLDRKSGIALVCRQFRTDARSVPAERLIVTACSAKCLTNGLHLLVHRRDVRSRVSTVIVTERRRFPVDVCNSNWVQFCQVGLDWEKELTSQSRDIMEEWWSSSVITISSTPHVMVGKSAVFLRVNLKRQGDPF